MLIISQDSNCPLLGLLVCLPDLLLLCMFIKNIDKAHKNAACRMLSMGTISVRVKERLNASDALWSWATR